MCNLTLEGSPRYRSGSCAICTGPSSIYKYVKFDHKCACAVILLQHIFSVCRLRGRGFDSRIGTFFFHSFFFLSPLSFSFMLAPPLKSTSNALQHKARIYIIILYPDERRPTTVRSNDTLVDTPFQLISGFFHVNQGVLCC